ncbi:Stealth-like protein [Volucribacter psittacicida]|uniref:Stealth-like protein n=1 Tax=Volucribacter psittacicida TaxID=203482 RepID=A0A4R1FVU8_9PAST|nr:stealth family protein [Volucribacter psittacicida]TCJ97899.1 Stealth-like protein [Volucribacter psittacicida]
MKNIRKLFTNPHIFFRDYLNKKYPIKNIEQPYHEDEERTVINIEKKLNSVITRNCLDKENQNNVDIVFTWVNNSDKNWLEKYHKYNNGDVISALYATDMARFCNHNELFYSVNSVLRFLPWVNKIYIITDNQVPFWFKNHPKVKIIDHREIIDDRFLPTFNSHVIEAFLYKIPDLSENFIYFNDDVFVAQELSKEHFFLQNGIASIFLADKSLKKMESKGKITATLSASKNSIFLLKKYYNINIDTPLVHTYIPLKRSAYELAWSLYEEAILAFLPNKFRNNNDINLANFLVPWLMYLEGKSVPRSDICYYFNIRSRNAPIQYKKLLNKKNLNESPHSFCANDFNSISESIPDYQKQLINMLNNYYD